MSGRRREKQEQLPATKGDVRRAVEKSELALGRALLKEHRGFADQLDEKLEAWQRDEQQARVTWQFEMEERWLEKARELHQITTDARVARSRWWRRLFAWWPW